MPPDLDRDMLRPFPQYQALLSLLVALTSFICLSIGANTNPQTIISLVAYQELDPCAQACYFFSAYVPGCTYSVEVHIGCSWACYTGASNDCFCRADKQSVATSFLSSCISSACTVGNKQINVNSGVGTFIRVIAHPWGMASWQRQRCRLRLCPYRPLLHLCM